MMKLGFGLFPICLVTVVFGCGSSGPQTTTAVADPQSEPAAGAQAQAQAQADPKVAEAEQRCSAEIEQAELQPPDQLSKIQIQACMYAAMPEVQACGKGAAKEVVLKIVIDKDGSVTNAFPVGASADSPEAGCVVDVIKGVKFPKFKGQPQQNLKYPFTIGN